MHLCAISLSSLPDFWEKTAALPNGENRTHTTHPAQNRKKNGFMKCEQMHNYFPLGPGTERAVQLQS